MKLNKKYHQKTPKNRTDLLKKIFSRKKAQAAETLTYLRLVKLTLCYRALKTLSLCVAHMLGRCGEDQFTAKTRGISLGENRAAGIFIKSSAR